MKEERSVRRLTAHILAAVGKALNFYRSEEDAIGTGTNAKEDENRNHSDD
jgi:hypothetical protein